MAKSRSEPKRSRTAVTRGQSRARAPRLSIRELRRRLGLTQVELAELLGVHAMTVSKWERGTARPATHPGLVLRALERAARRGLPAAPAADQVRKDPLARLTALLERAYARPDLELGALSATNRFPGRVLEVVRGDVMSKVVVEIAPGLCMGAVITTDSVQRLGLVRGARAMAIIKATEVLIGGYA